MDFLLVGMICTLGMLAVLMFVDVIRGVLRGRPSPPPATRGHLRLFDTDGKTVISARLSVQGLQKLLEDHRRGRLG